MLIISLKDNKKKMKEKGLKRQKKNKGMTPAVLKVWELNDYVVRLS